MQIATFQVYHLKAFSFEFAGSRLTPTSASTVDVIGLLLIEFG